MAVPATTWLRHHSPHRLVCESRTNEVSGGALENRPPRELSVERPPEIKSRPGRYQLSPVKDAGFSLIFPPNLRENLFGLALIAAFVVLVGGLKRRRRGAAPAVVGGS
jgi:hypothetical protein